MTALIHLVYAAATMVVGLTVGAVSPFLWAGVDTADGVVIGVLVVLAGGLSQEVAARLLSDRGTARRLRRLEEAVAELREEGARRRGEIEAVTKRLEETARSGGDTDAVMNEVRLLRSLVGRLREPPAVERPASSRPPAREAGESGAPLIPKSGADASVLDVVRDALRADRVDILLQPIVSLPQRKHRFYEVFSRVRSADGVQIHPERYLEPAVREGLISAIDNLLLVRCVQLIRETERRRHSVGFFSNISRETINDVEFMRQFLNFMERNRSLVPKLVFELSQEDWESGDAATLTPLSRLAELGFHFSMDQVTRLDIDPDFLAEREIRFLKIDRASVRDPAARALRRALAERSVDVIVEKIETEDQLREILDLGIDFGQGYLFGEPRLSRKPG